MSENRSEQHLIDLRVFCLVFVYECVRPKREWAMVPTKLIRPRFSCLSFLRPALSIVRIVEILLIRELTLIAARWRKASTEPKMLLASEQNVRFEIIGRPLHVNPSVVMSLLYCIMGIFKSKICVHVSVLTSMATTGVKYTP